MNLDAGTLDRRQSSSLTRSVLPATAGLQVDRLALERKLLQLPVLSWTSDPEWARWGVGTALYLILAPIRPALKDAARKYRDRPATGSRMRQRILAAHLRRLHNDPSQRYNVVWLRERIQEAIAVGELKPGQIVDEGPSLATSALLRSMPERVVKALLFFLPVVEAHLTGQPVPTLDRNEAIRHLKALTARPAGNKRLALGDEAKRLYDQGKSKGRRGMHKLCLALQESVNSGAVNARQDDPIRTYDVDPPWKQNATQQRMRTAISRRQ